MRVVSAPVCPMCEGRKTIYSLERTRMEACVVCSGTGRVPLTRSQGAQRRAARLDRVKRKR